MSQFADGYILANAKFLPKEVIPSLHAALENLTPESQLVLAGIKFNDPSLGMVLSIFFGVFGVDRFYNGNVWLGLGKVVATFFSYGIAGAIWTFVDWFFIVKAIRKKNLQKLIRILAEQPRI